MKKKPFGFLPNPHPCSFALLIPIFFAVCQALQTSNTHASPSDFSRFQSIRVGFSNAGSFEKPVFLLQDDGSVDTVKTFLLELPDGVGPDDVVLTQATSNRKVLNFKDNENLLQSSSNGVLNITSTFSFDEMAGKCDYTIRAIRKGTDREIGAVTVKFVIVGVTLYIEELEGAIFIVSGVGRRYSIPYKETVERLIAENRKIRAFIQYADGSTSDDFEGRPIPFVQSLKISTTGSQDIFQHDGNLCSVDKLGTLTGDRRLELPNGCGYGFYYDSAGNLCFGIAFDPYRTGSVVFRLSWPGITNGFEPLSGESMELSLLADVTGVPPVVVLRRVPDHGHLRPKGGEVITLDIINGHLHNITSYHIEVFTVNHYFALLPGSFRDSKAFPFAKEVSFISEPGSGKDLKWALVYQVDSFSNGRFAQFFEDAVYLPKTKDFFTYDDIPLSIQSMSPSMGSEDGGTEITISGHFPFFDPERDGLFFTGTKLDISKIKSVSENVIVFLSPSKAELGESYEHRVTIRMGFDVSNPSLFYFLVKNAAVRVSQSGTSELGNNAYRIGACTPARFTAVVVPYTNQIRSYKWSLHSAGNEETNLLETEPFASANPSAQTLEVFPDTIALGGYTLRIEVSLLGAKLETEIILMRDEVVSIGVFILEPPKRTIAHPDTPLRLSAVIRTPPCYTGNQKMIFEWKAFGQTQRFSSSNATDVPHEGLRTTTPSRLGWEYVVPRDKLKVGTHPVSLRVWMEESENVFGVAESEVIIFKSLLTAIIRHGEEQITANYLSSLSIFGSKSYDPDILGPEKYDGLVYEWKCLQSSTKNFAPTASEPCIEALLPSSDLVFFDVRFDVLESLTEIKFLQYSLLVRKDGGRVSQEAKLVIEIRSDGALPHLNEYETAMINADGEILNLMEIPYYEQSILEVLASPDVTWSFELLEPDEPDFFSSANLIRSPLFYSPEASLYSVIGSNRPLGIESWKLRPFTKYRIKIVFDATAQNDATEVIMSIRTTPALIIGFPTPTIVEGTTSTTFTATAGIPLARSGFSFYFVLTDSQGYEFCLGGCTGYDVIYFMIGRPGLYVITAYLFDMQGKALLDSSRLAQEIRVHPSDLPLDYRQELDTLFATGNDPCWTQLAHELAISLLEAETATVAVRQSGEDNESQAKDMEDKRESKSDMVIYLSRGARQIVCTAYPNSYHGKDFMTFAFDLTSHSSFGQETFYNVLQGLTCSIVNAPSGTINMMQKMFPQFLVQMNKHALNLFQGGTTRNRLRNKDTPFFADQLADLLLWTSSFMYQSITSGKVFGFASTLRIGAGGKDGVISFVVAENAGHLQTRVQAGNVLNVVKGSQVEEFIPRDTCQANLFAGQKRKLIFVFHIMPDFIAEGGFQDEPSGKNLAQKWYIARVFAKEDNGQFGEVLPQTDDYCFCWKLPIREIQEELSGSIDYMPGLVAATNFKAPEVPTEGKGDVFVYQTDGKTRDYDQNSTWVEACRKDLGAMVTSTRVLRAAENVVAGPARVLGTGTITIGVVVVGVLLFIVAAMACSWILAVRAMSGGEQPLATVVPDELYVERDVYGRATIYDANAIRVD